MRKAAKRMGLITKYVLLAYIGATLYQLIEIAFRGFTHWSSACMGSIAFLYLGCQNENTDWDEPIWVQMIKGSIVITIIEFFTGLIVNVWLKEGAWDYSNLWGNILGQVCPLFSCCIWPWISLLGIVLDDYLRYWFFGEDKPRYHLWW